MSSELITALIYVAVLFIIGAIIIIARMRKTKKAEREAQAKRLKEQEAEAKLEKERQEQSKMADAKVDLYINSYSEALKYLKDKDAADWIVTYIIDNIIEDLGKESLLRAHRNIHITDHIELGPYTLDRTQFEEWNKAYKNYLASMESAKKELAAKKKQKKTMQRQAWQNYVKKYKALNYAQQENELEWFKKKVVQKLTKDKDQQDKLIHQLEIAHLGKKTKNN